MNVFILDADVNNYRGIYYKDEDDIVDFNRRFVGTPLKEKWTGQDKFEFVPRRKPKGDTPGLSSHIPVFSVKALDALADFLKPSGELLPIICDGERYFLFNATLVLDALDEPKCEIKRFKDGGIMRVISHHFIPDRLGGISVFKVPQQVLAHVFVTDPVVERVKEARLKGFEFRLVWSSD